MTEGTLSHYRVVEQLGEGASAVVYLAEDLVLGRPVVLKLLPPHLSAGPEARARLLQEARTISSLNHPNICTIYEIAEHDGRPFLVMELLDGQPLAAMLAGRPLETATILDLAIQIADGLDAAHARGIVHRDIKPPNLFVTHRGQVKILDFGIAVLSKVERGPRPDPTSSRPASAQWGGTLPYMSPEQVRGEELDARSDLFSLGCVLYEMATGRRAFTGADIPQVAAAILAEPPAPPSRLNPVLPVGLDRIVMGSLERERALRCQTAADVRADLQRVKRDLDAAVLAAQSAEHAAVASTRAAAAIASRRRSAAAVVVLAACGVTALTVLGAPSFQRYTPAPPATPEPAPVRPAAARPSRATPLAPRTAPGEPTPEPPPPALRPSGPETVAAPPVAEPESPRPAPPPPPPVAAAEPAPVRPPSIEPELRIARAQADHKLHEQALGTLRDALSKDPPSAMAVDAYFLMASIQEAQQKTDDAMATYVVVADRFRDHPRAAEAMFLLAQATLRSRRDGREAEARTILGNVIDRHPRGVWAVRALMAKADLEERKGLHQFDEVLATVVPAALVTYRKVIERDGSPPEREHALWQAGQLYERVKRFYLAAQAYTTLAEQYPETGYDAWAAAAKVYDKRLKDPAQARAAYARVPPSSPSFRDAQKFVGR